MIIKMALAITMTKTMTMTMTGSKTMTIEIAITMGLIAVFFFKKINKQNAPIEREIKNI